MATFKVGQRVRITKAGYPAAIKRAGYCGTVLCKTPFFWDLDLIFATAIFGQLYDVRVDELGEGYIIPGGWLAPLTDPKADAFLERMRKLKPYDEPKVEPVRQGTPIWK